MTGFLLILLGAWGGLVPFIGPHFGYAYTPNVTWQMTSGRLFLEVLPGAAAVLGGLIMLGSTHRAAAVWGSWLAAIGGAWFVVGPSLSRLWAGGQSQAGTPTATSTLGTTVQEIGFFYGVGAVILFFAAVGLGRLSVVGVRDAAAAATAAEEASEMPSAAGASSTVAADAPTTVYRPPGVYRDSGSGDAEETSAEQTARHRAAGEQPMGGEGRPPTPPMGPGA